MKRRIIAISIFSVVITGGIAHAADLPGPVYKNPPMAAAVDPSGFYVWADGAADWIKLPSYGLGLHSGTVGASRIDNGPTTTFDPNVTAAAVRGAIGYMTATGLRFEIGGSFAQGSRTQTNSVGLSGPLSLVVPVNLNGAVPGASFSCQVSCTVNSSLSSNYRTWQITDLTAIDYRIGAIVWTPSVTLFGGNSRNSEALAQLLVATAAPQQTYNANTSLNWTDVGARAGLNAAYNVNSWLTLDAGGFLGGAYRSVTLNGADTTPAPDANPSATVVANSSTGDFVANAEIGLAAKITAGTWFKAFMGFNYDGRVPGISSPSFVGAAPVSTPAGVTYASETSYYAGGGLNIKFGAP